MRMWSLFFISVIVAAQPVIAAEKTASPPSAMTISLKSRQPNWRLQIMESHPNGQPKCVIFYEPKISGAEIPVKQIYYYEQGAIASEADVIEIAQDEPAFGTWNATTVPHGMKVDFSMKGAICKVSQFNRGMLEGESRLFFPDGHVDAIIHYSNGQANGTVEVYYKDGQKKEDAHYVNGELSGEDVQYYPDGTRLSQAVYVAGMLQGAAMEWYSNGALKTQSQFSGGKLHGDGKNPALIVYDEKRNLTEVRDFHSGEPVGFHICYHPNGKEKYRVNYKNGKKRRSGADIRRRWNTARRRAVY